MAQLNLQNLSEFVAEKLAGTDCFPVRIDINGADVIVEIDSDSRIDIDFVAALNRDIEEHFAPEIDDYNVEVGSVGLTSPLKLPRQFKKHEGNDVEVLTKEGKKIHGMLKSADETGFVLATTQKVKKEGEKKPRLETVVTRYGYDEVKSVVYELKF